ncbi:hypothetical protein SLS55_009265 [Diplodia seriata]|uniref:Putative ATPase YjoB n=1 Tax=Diplodia seriata TaxID=420778 RepID=A0A0G2E5D6_9PEZI|nr:putative atpase aaa+ type core [Diplodia seriata]OMP81374.1 putative ATPase YjoB [Diplodia seriata]
MPADDSFSIISQSGGDRLFDEYHSQTAAKKIDLDVQLVSSLRAQHPQLIVTTVPEGNCPLLQFSAAGHATAELDRESEPVIQWRGVSGGGPSSSVSIAQANFFAKYHYKWANEDFILYTVKIGYSTLQYVLKEPVDGETPSSSSSIVDALLRAIGTWMSQSKAIYVYDGYWSRSSELWKQVEKASWDKVILDPKTKKSLRDVSRKFFDNRDVYEDYGIAWKRGLIFHGPAGNGKTISIKAMMHELSERNPSIPTLYVKNAPYTYMLGDVFRLARQMSPCLLVLEDIDTVVTDQSRSYFFNEVDGLASNDGILMIASTNHLDKLDPGLTKRPSRFDRKYLFPLPSRDERVLYCQYWRDKLKGKKTIDFPEKLCPAIADITDEFSFAFLQEAFVAMLLQLAHSGEDSESSDSEDEDEGSPLDRYELWRVIKKQVKILREQMDSSEPAVPEACEASSGGVYLSAYEERLPLRERAELSSGSGTRLSRPTSGRDALSELHDAGQSGFSEAAVSDLHSYPGFVGDGVGAGWSIGA